MRMLNWMHEKLRSKHTSKKSTVSDAFITNNKASKKSEAISLKRRETKEWQHGLLTIGTLGGPEIDAKNIENCQLLHEKPSPIEELIEFTSEEVGKLKQELRKYLALKHSRQATDQESQSRGGEHKNDRPLNQFLNCPSSLEVDRRSNPQLDQQTGGEEEDQDNYHILTKTNVCVGGTTTGISQRSVTFLLKKMFVCQGGFGPVPSLRDPPFLEPRIGSRIEKLFRAILHRKIYQQTAALSKKLIKSNAIIETDTDDETSTMESDKCKWVKTDSEFIVLEM